MPRRLYRWRWSTKKPITRRNALYDQDAKDVVRLSYENPEIKAIYDDFLGKPLGTLSEQLLHQHDGV